LRSLLADIGDVARELLAPELGLADLHVELVDVDRGERVVLDEPLADDDRVLEVVAVEGVERDEHVLAQGELAVRVAAPSAMICPGLDLLALGTTIGFWFWQVRSLRPTNLRSSYSSELSMMMPLESAKVTVPAFFAFTTMPLFAADRDLHARRDDRGVGEQQAPPGAACSSPSGPGSRRRARGTGSARRRRPRSAWARCRRSRPRWSRSAELAVDTGQDVAVLERAVLLERVGRREDGADLLVGAEVGDLRGDLALLDGRYGVMRKPYSSTLL
jgi:hypothetical protein